MAQHISKNAKCPFYLKHEGTRIICEGVSKGNSLHLVFCSQAERSKYMSDRCDNLKGCHVCLVYNTLMAKWEDN